MQFNILNFYVLYFHLALDVNKQKKKVLSDKKSQNLGRAKVMAKVMMLRAGKKTRNLYQEKGNENIISGLEKQFY